MQRVGSHHVRLDSKRRTIRFDAAGVEINLGAIGKGYALDRAAHLLVDRGATDFLLHGGQSSVLARGDRGPASPSESTTAGSADHPASAADTDGGTASLDDGRGWLVGLGHPLRRGRRMALVRLRDRALGTSGSGMQSFVHRGKRYGHILDPRTGRPAEGILSVSVVAETAATADALATGLYVMGVQPALDFCERHKQIAAIITAPGKQRGGIELHVAGLAPADWQRVDA
jgi:thiamine biosynthesis lipoprotein